ncbi:hypothetical protein ER45_029155 (plasmid) [Bacillus mycoides]|nr:hypothetical protein ER45_029155 [Bacillus mycoides]
MISANIFKGLGTAVTLERMVVEPIFPHADTKQPPQYNKILILKDSKYSFYSDGWNDIPGFGKVYVSNSYIMKGSKLINGKYYYFHGYDGKIITNQTITVDGKKYKFDENGIETEEKTEIKTGFVNENGGMCLYGDGSTPVYKISMGHSLNRERIPLEKGQLLDGTGVYEIEDNYVRLAGRYIYINA